MIKPNLCILILIFSFSLAWAEDQSAQTKPQLGPGMEAKKVGSINVIVPSDADVHFEGSRLKVESTNEYVARKFKNLESRMAALELRLQNVENALKSLQESLEKFVANTAAQELFKLSDEAPKK